MHRVPLVLLPTPLHPLPRLSAELGVDLWIKRDDLTGLVFGGNKGRKLEYLIGEAIASGADTVVTCGSLQSNFIRQLGAACSMYGLRSEAVVMELPYDGAAGTAPQVSADHRSGNALLDKLLGVELHLCPNGDWLTLFAAAEDLAKVREREGRAVYRIPVGGSAPTGSFAFVQAAHELMAQSPELFDWIVFASSSGGTQTGLAHAFWGSQTRVLGIACDPEPEIAEDFALLAEGLNRLVGGSHSLTAADFLIDFGFVGKGYGVPSTAGLAAIELVARREGIFLDPIYSAKAFAGLLHLVETQMISGRVLFWHTGGTPALFSFLKA